MRFLHSMACISAYNEWKNIAKNLRSKMGQQTTLQPFADTSVTLVIVLSQGVLVSCDDPGAERRPRLRAEAEVFGITRP